MFALNPTEEKKRLVRTFDERQGEAEEAVSLLSGCQSSFSMHHAVFIMYYINYIPTESVYRTESRANLNAYHDILFPCKRGKLIH